MDAIEWVRRAILRAYPNPDRIGCPPSEVVEAMARRTIPKNSAVEDHIFHCSPCYATYLGVQRQIWPHRYMRRSAFLALATLLVASLAFYTYRQLYPAPAPPQEFARTFDYVDHPVYRSSKQMPSHPFELPRGIVHLTVILPLGSPPGQYQLQIRPDGRIKPVLTASAQGVLDPNGSTIMHVDVNSRYLKPGEYSFGIRARDDGWNEVPLLIPSTTDLWVIKTQSGSTLRGEDAG